MIKAFILAGGKGARLRPLVLNTPKPIVPLANIPFLFFQIDRIKQAGITEIILSLSYQPRKITEIFSDGMKYGVTMRYAHEDLPLGTAGALKAAANIIDDTVIVLNGDVLTDIRLKDILQYHREKKAEATIAITVNPVNLHAPVLGTIGNQSVDEGETLAFAATATDLDEPATALTYSLDTGAPAGAAINPMTSAAIGVTKAQGAVMATRPPRAPFIAILTSHLRV